MRMNRDPAAARPRAPESGSVGVLRGSLARRAIEIWLVVLAYLGLAVVCIYALGDFLRQTDHPQLAFWNSFDAHTIWATAHRPTLYFAAPKLYQVDAYFYSPAFAQLIRPLASLPWPVFRLVWAIPAVGAFVWMLRPASRRFLPPLIVFAAFSIESGNVEWLYGLVAIFTVTTPGGWAVPLLTKITPGVGMAWYAGRREWRKLLLALGVTIFIATISFVLAPSLWSDWVRALTYASAHQSPNGMANAPIVIRVAAALAIVLGGAILGHRWTLVIAMLVAQPDINPSTFGLLCALPRLTNFPSMNSLLTSAWTRVAGG
jgi:hypothetical protein